MWLLRGTWVCGLGEKEAIGEVMVCTFYLLQTSGPGSCVKLDGANGVGAEKVRRLMRHIDSAVLSVEVLNDGSCGALNEKVGQLPKSGSPHFSVLKSGSPYIGYQSSGPPPP